MRLLLLLPLIVMSLETSAQTVNIPDTTFKSYLLSVPGLDANGDGEIQVTEASVCTESLTLPGAGISDLTGIEAFVSIPYLQCSNNALTSLDVSNNTALNYLYCWSNNLSSLDVSNNPNLVGLSFAFNSIDTIDLSQNLNLTTLNCKNNQLTHLDLSSNPVLENINAASNELSSLNVANGNNVNFILFSTIDNPNLNCIQVDDPLYSESNWTNVNYFKFDSQHSFSSNCTLGSASLDSMQSLMVYPNPAKEVLHIDAAMEIDAVCIYQMSGELILRSTATSINIQSLDSGMYLVRVFSGDTSECRYIVKE